MSRFGDPFGELFGSDGNTALIWRFSVDWEGTGDFSSNESDWMKDLYCKRGRDRLLNTSASGFEEFCNGELRVVLANNDGRYDPYNSYSPLYPNVRPGKNVICSVKNGEDGTEYPIMTGKIESPYNSPDETVTIKVLDNQKALKKAKPSIGVVENGSVTDLYPLIISSSGWGWGSTIIGGNDYLPLFWGGENAWVTAWQLAEAVFGTVFIAADGELKFISRRAGQTPIMTIDENQILKGIPFAMPWESIRNKVTVKAHPKDRAEWVIVGTFSGAIRIMAGETVNFDIEHSYDGDACVAKDVIVSSLFVNRYKSNNEDYDLSCSYTSSTVGTKTTVTVSNTSGIDGYIVESTLIGTAFYDEDEAIIERIDANSYANDGELPFEIDNPYMERNLARDIASYLRTELVKSRGFPGMQIEGRPEIQFGLDLMDVFTFDAPSIGMNANFRVGMIEHKWMAETGQMVHTNITGEPPFQLPTGWVWPAQFGAASSKFGF